MNVDFVLERLGGGNAALLAFATSYISDISKKESRTARVSTANSLWYLGGPLGTLAGALLVRNKDFGVALGVCLACYSVSLCYVALFVKESYGPFARDSEVEQSGNDSKIEVLQMVKDFFNVRRVVECFRTLFAKREGRVRVILLAIVSSNMIRRAARCKHFHTTTLHNVFNLKKQKK